MSRALSDVRAAATRIAPWVARTPVLTSRTLDGHAGAKIFFKCENFQRIGAFKARGAHNAVLSLPADLLPRGVVTHSSGNHAAALALAARNVGTRAYIAMPRGAPKAKVASVQRLGGEIVFCEPTLPAREACCAEIQERTGATLVHPYDDWQVIAGQGTAALELIEEISGLDAIVTPVGGGGLLAGTAIVGSELGVDVHGAEPAAVDDAYRSFVSGTLQPPTGGQTVADGLRASLGERPFAVIRRARAGHHDRFRGGDRRGDAPRLGGDEDHHRAVERGAGGRGAQRAHAAFGKTRRRDPHGRQRGPRRAALEVALPRAAASTQEPLRIDPQRPSNVQGISRDALGPPSRISATGGISIVAIPAEASAALRRGNSCSRIDCHAASARSSRAAVSATARRCGSVGARSVDSTSVATERSTPPMARRFRSSARSPAPELSGVRCLSNSSSALIASEFFGFSFRNSPVRSPRYSISAAPA